MDQEEKVGLKYLFCHSVIFIRDTSPEIQDHVSIGVERATPAADQIAAFIVVVI